MQIINGLKVLDEAEIIQEIKEFLDENEVKYEQRQTKVRPIIDSEKEIIFNSFFIDNGDKRSYEICPVSSKNYYISYPKYGIVGVKKEYFYIESLNAENDGSFKCWVKDFEWNDDRKREVLKSYFLHAFGMTKTRFYARDCIVKEVSKQEAREFESINCFYGKRGASLNLGLYLKKDKNGVKKDTLLMIYTFGHNFFGKDNSIEVLRVGTKRFNQVIGGASKLLKNFQNNYPMLKVGKKYIRTEKIKFYSDYDHNIGMSMDNLGFEFLSYSKGGFMNYWIEEGVVKGRMPAKHQWVMKQMQEEKCFAVPNAGVKTFVMNNTKTEEVYNKFMKDNNIIEVEGIRI